MPDTTEQAKAARYTNVDDFVLDGYTSLSFKRALGDRTVGGTSWASPGWVGGRHHRRLIAYKIRDLYYQNAARHVLPTGDLKERTNHREYGDVFLLVETVLSALLGDEQQIVVPGSENFDESSNTTQLQGQQDQTPEETTQAERASLLENDLRRWADKEMFPAKLLEVERSAVKLGDGVYVLGWSSKKKRPRLRVYDPGLYFPVPTEGNEDDFFDRVHIAWELPRETPDDTTVQVRRITWELLDTAPAKVPWDTDGRQCYMSDGIFTLDKQKTTDVDEFQEANVKWMTNEDGDEVKRLPLGIDFIPVVHIPNTVALLYGFGRALVDSVAQIVDDISRADTDLQQAGRLAGFPPLAVGKAVLETDEADPSKTRVITYGPGTAFEIGEGTLTAVDLSNGVTVLINYVNHLIARLEVNARVPSGILGRLKPSEVPSGVALALGFGPLTTMIKEMRIVRDEKYRLLLKFVTRLLWVNDQLGQDPPEEDPLLALGHYLPVDQDAAVNRVNILLTAKAISRPQALVMLIDAGFAIEDAAQEIAAIQSTDFTGANELLAATDDFEYVRKYLGIPGAVPPPPIPAAPLPGGPPASNGQPQPATPPGAQV